MSRPSNQKLLRGAERTRLLEELYKKYSRSQNWKQRLLYWRKKYSWLIIVEGTKFLKRVFDVFTALFLLIVLSPLMLIIALLIKTDGGPILYISDRVGKWGKEFRFPKFRTMKPGSENMLESLRNQSNLKDVTFKMKQDPRVTWIGKYLRKTSLDELPQLVCVISGQMSLVGPRPPLPQEVAYYTIEERRRLDITPGLTCIWQVSGRSDISFAGQVKLDMQYIESQSFWLDLKLLLKTIPAVIFGRGAY